MGDGSKDWRRLAGRGGFVLGVAVDHRDSFHAALHARGIEQVDDELVAAIKVDVCTALAGGATMLLIDHEVGWSGLRAARSEVLPDVPVAMPLEAQGYGELHEVEATRLVEHPTPAEVAAAGGSACKLLLPFRPDLVERAERQRTVAAATVAVCHAAGLPLILEPIVWSAPGEELEPARLTELVVESARSLAPLAPGLLKLQYPGSREACDELHAACGGHPWVLLGGGAPLTELERQLKDACRAGAVGCIVGRSLFDGALDADSARRRAWLLKVARPALRRLHAVATACVQRPG